MVNSAFPNNPLCVGRDHSYGRAPGLTIHAAGRDRCPPTGIFKGSGTIMKKVAVTALVLALGLAGCNKAAENTAANETAVENTAAADVNAANATSAADSALNAPATENAGNAVDNTGNAVAKTTENK